MKVWYGGEFGDLSETGTSLTVQLESTYLYIISHLRQTFRVPKYSIDISSSVCFISMKNTKMHAYRTHTLGKFGTYDASFAPRRCNVSAVRGEIFPSISASYCLLRHIVPR